MSDNIKKIVAKNLLYYRKKNKITQQALADQLGVKHNAISSWKMELIRLTSILYFGYAKFLVLLLTICTK